jgi:hypothetical protein
MFRLMQLRTKNNLLTNRKIKFIIAFNICKGSDEKEYIFSDPQRENDWCKFS